jgi:hypothetical protein
MNRSLVILGLILISSNLNSQSFNFDNDSVKYQIIIKTKDLNSTENKNGVYFVKMNLNKTLKDSLKCKRFDFWMVKFNNENQDWAATLVLYYLYRRDAPSIVLVERNREKWLTIKDNEIREWRNFFSEKSQKQNCR